MILRRWLVLAGAILFSACLTEPRGLLFFEIDTPPPDTTTAGSVTIAGRVVRAPPKLGLQITVQVTGGAEPVDDITTALGVFSLSVPLKLETDNELVLSADDGTDSNSEELKYTVTQTKPATQFRGPGP